MSILTYTNTSASTTSSCAVVFTDRIFIAQLGDTDVTVR